MFLSRRVISGFSLAILGWLSPIILLANIDAQRSDQLDLCFNFPLDCEKYFDGYSIDAERSSPERKVYYVEKTAYKSAWYFYSTNRYIKTEILNAPIVRYNEAFTDQTNGGTPMFGKIRVSVPAIHVRGKSEFPHKEKNQDPFKHFVLGSHEFFDASQLQEILEAESERNGTAKLLTYVHGVNNTFPDAVRRLAQLKTDLPYEGMAFLFSWPSRRWEIYNSLNNYQVDRANADISSRILTKTLKTLSASAQREHSLIAHSHGAKVMAQTLVDLGAGGITDIGVKSIIMVAPDISVAKFEQYYDDLSNLPRNTMFAVYTYTDDRILKRAEQWDKQPRLGRSNIEDGVFENVMITNVRGELKKSMSHSYFYVAPEMLDDISMVLNVDDLKLKSSDMDMIRELWIGDKP